MDTNNLMPITIPVLCLLLIHVVPVVRSQANQQYSNCSQSFRCANFNNLTYPFWGQNRPAYCGHPSFRLTCTGNSPLLTITNMQYRVLAIDNSNQILTVARQDLYNNSCPDSFRNTTLNFNFFDYQPGFQNLALYYGCSSNQSIRNQFECAGNMTRRTGYFVPANSSWFNSSCDVSISVPVNQTYAAALSSASATVSDLRQAIDSGFGLTWRSNDGECDRCVQSGGRCGHNTTSNSTSDSFICFCSDRPYRLVCGTGTRTGRDNIGRSLAIGLSVSAVGTMIIALAIFSYFRRQSSSFRAMAYWKHKNTSDQDIEDLIKSYGSLAPKRYNFSEIKKMTNSFSEKLGQGGFGSVFKGKLPDGHLVAVKILSEMKGNGEEFINEVASISRTSHVNVVTLLGFCYKGTKRALIYEFMPNGSLDKFICNDGPHDKNPPLQWKTLYEISVGIARGLDYLHRGCNTRIVHFDIKPQNILLDQDFCPKIADFGLAKLCQRKESILSMLDARGTIGYIAPEVFLRNLGGVSHKSDVYSYGMMVLEMAGAKNKNNFAGGSTTTSETYFPDWIYKYIEFGGNLRVEGVEIEEDQEETVKKMILVSLWCIQTNPSDRPSISKVLEMLEGSLQSLQIPPRPLFSPKNSFRETSTFFSEDFP